MKTAIVYCSQHQGNTKKLIDALSAAYDVTAINAVEADGADLSGYDMVGFASGIYYSKFHKTVLQFAQQNLPEGKPVFFLYTCGAEKQGYTKAIAEAVSGKNARVAGEFGCLGLDTFGPFKLIGGIAKGHPSADELEKARAFYQSICREK